MIIPIPGIVLMSSGDTRITRNRSQTAAQIARQDIDAVRNGALIISGFDELILQIGPQDEMVAEAMPTNAAARRRWLGRVDDYRTALLGLLAQPTPEFSQILEAAR
jgi:hypothetical protein